MKRRRYIYNPDTCQYERFQLRGKSLRRRIGLYVTLSLGLGIVAFVVSLQFVPSFDEALLQHRNDKLKRQWSLLQQQIAQSDKALSQLIRKDDETYRAMLDAPSLDSAIRAAGVGGSQKYTLSKADAFPEIVATYEMLDQVRRTAQIEKQSFEELDRMLNTKMKAWRSRPAIQPIDNKQLRVLHLTYGMRFHPIFKVWTEHNGLDFAAPLGTPVYATGDGEVSMSYYSGSYGNVVYLEHGFGFESRYAHLQSYVVKQGERVKRGQLIGYVGNTGNSVAPHLHYEVLFAGKHVNPINFFQRDLSNEQYQKLIEKASTNTNPLD